MTTPEKQHSHTFPSKRPSPKKGLWHWGMQRLTSVLLIPLSLWFFSFMADVGKEGYAAYQSWMASSLHAVLFILFITLLFYHAVLGMQAVMEDYLGSEKVKKACIKSLKTMATLLVVIAILAILDIHMEN